MSLLTPDFGLLFWMILSFAIVFGILARFGFPVITKMVDERHDYICRSLEAADEANKKLEHIKQESESILNEARTRQAEIINKALVQSNEMIRKAKENALLEGKRQSVEAMRQLETEKQKAMNEIRSQVALLSVDIAEKVLRRELNQPESQQALIAKLLDEIESEAGNN
ncbi:MAG: F0F1 ATP synthase subunit B [Tannerella sp.]|jgi:F-type H+-transporting ATPase subunit b|nr:F0F1 ATP synthase subunit B [Tannerella sp.]